MTSPFCTPSFKKVPAAAVISGGGPADPVVAVPVLIIPGTGIFISSLGITGIADIA
jgi:hypothetical protein